uniref:Uncharacterized protein n=1 Tax=Brassica oleracea var. oleracea TaxID=109376 RepID=A0A0D3E088_BRAOL
MYSINKLLIDKSGCLHLSVVRLDSTGTGMLMHGFIGEQKQSCMNCWKKSWRIYVANQFNSHKKKP